MRAARRIFLSSCVIVVGLPGCTVISENVRTNRGMTYPGYSIEYGEATPRPGSFLREGDSVHFSVRFRYVLQSAEKGRIILTFRDERGARILKDREVGLAIKRGTTRTATLSQNVIVPSGVQTLFLLIPLVPDDLNGEASASLEIRYPIGGKR